MGGSRKNLEVSLSESSRKFITCIRKYMILYLNLLEKNRDLWTLEKAYTYLRTDKRVPPNYRITMSGYIFYLHIKQPFSLSLL